ncbi:uncharacterized protein LOC114746606 [Neltuma alba]|uniref:uncharacterized protein LOC114746606 n=1 Tax=Neltuma alba TaxID=207710 RepID=UPI0010A5924F|nr:uncharacterized protein LOC114746606 [Prosopis alba]XP_028790668.1 uncharacterized protein LOC114746606 [Prosopis alba]XP_028790669.1 uncharacterized protein LOC114746606 [Prosopis alba]
MSVSRFLFSNGILLHTPDAPPVKVLLEANPGAYTTTRTHDRGSYLLFWERHMKRLSESIHTLSNLAPQLLFKSDKSTSSSPSSVNLPIWQPTVQMLVNDSISKVLPIALKEINDCQELAITTLVCGNLDALNAQKTVECEERLSKTLEVHVHVETYIPPSFGIRDNGVNLALVGWGRNVASAKYSDWVRLRQSLEKLRPPSVTELLLSNDGDQVLEGCITNFFVVCGKDTSNDSHRNGNSFQVQTAPISDGVLPGIIRQVVIEVCRSNGIPFREVAPSWSDREVWEEAFITNSLRILQHVDSVQVPTDWQSVHSKTWKDVSWEKKQFQGRPGKITAIIQELIMERAAQEGYASSNFMKCDQTSAGM